VLLSGHSADVSDANHRQLAAAHQRRLDTGTPNRVPKRRLERGKGRAFTAPAEDLPHECRDRNTGLEPNGGYS